MRNYVTTPAEATVDDLGRLYDGGGEHWYKVTVRTPPGWPKKAWRVYTIHAYTESIAGREGLERFAEEIDGKRPIPVLQV